MIVGPNAQRNRVIVIGLDGATFDLISPWVEQGKLPTFQRLLNDGASGPLESVPNQRSAAAWTSLATGLNPGKHGIYEFYEQAHGSYDIRFINSSAREGASLWKILSDHGRKVGVMNVPLTYPAERVNGFLIAGIDAPSIHIEGFAHPPELLEEINQKFGRYIIEPGVNGYIVQGDIDRAVESLRDEIRQKTEITRYLLENKPWDFFIVVFRSLDASQHGFWRFMDPAGQALDPEGARKYGNVILETYQQLDRAISDICEHMDDDTRVLIISDHGFGRKHKASNQLNYWLEEHGFLRFKGGTEHRLSPRSLMTSLYRFVSRNTSRALKERLKQFLPSLRNRVHSHLIYSQIDWAHTVAYNDDLFPIIRINLRGREPGGIVEPGRQYDDLVRELKQKLMECRDAELGVPIVDAVFHRDEIYTGPHTYRAPDLLVRWREDIAVTGIALQKEAARNARPPVPTEDARYISGDHRLNGILMAAGRGVKRNAAVSGARLIDIAPTVLCMMGLPIPEEMDGKVITDLFENSFLSEHPIQREASRTPAEPAEDFEPPDYSKEDEDEIRKRLEDLGYL
ncbi:MAG: alkaline phosphatase family protein [Candidatus Abyssubacteria bacterium]